MPSLRRPYLPSKRKREFHFGFYFFGNSDSLHKYEGHFEGQGVMVLLYNIGRRVNLTIRL